VDLQRTGESGGFSDFSLEHFRKEIKVLTNKIVDIKSCITDESFVHEAFSFGLLSDLCMWVEENEVPTDGVYWNLLSVLSSMVLKHPTGKQEVNEAYSAKHMEMMIFENALSASMSHEKPELLYGLNTKKKLGFQPIGSFEVWVGEGWHFHEG
jgi:hypothetical protein